MKMKFLVVSFVSFALSTASLALADEAKADKDCVKSNTEKSSAISKNADRKAASVEEEDEVSLIKRPYRHRGVLER